MRSDGILDIGPANAVKVNVINPDKARMCGQNDVFAGYLILGVAEVDVDAVLPCKRKLGIDVLACAGVFGLLHNDALIFVHFLCKTECCCKSGVACGSLFKTFEGSESFGDEEYAALRNGNIPVHVAEGTCRTARNIGTVRVYAERNAEACVPGCEALFVELSIACHVQAGEVDACTDNFCMTVGFAQTACSAGEIAAARIGADNNIGITIKLCTELLSNFITQSFNTGNAERGVEGSVEIACFFKQAENRAEKLGTDGELDNFCTESFAFACFSMISG